jgi:hypothetical protein
VRSADTAPKVKRSARESYSRPNSLSVPVMRAIRPSKVSRMAAAKTAAAAHTKSLSPAATSSSRLARKAVTTA